jgi:hypothetical protein
MADYFAHVPVFAEDIFRRRYCAILIVIVFSVVHLVHVFTCTSPAVRFQMCKAMFLDISNDLNQEFEYFQRRSNHAGVPGFATIQKVTAAVRMLAYGGAADMFDEYVRMGESTMIECLNHFTRAVIEKYGDTYRRQPNDDDIARLLHKAEQRGFPGMLGSIDCMHWEWEKCPTSWHGQYRGHHKKPTIILEAVASYDRWIWHAFFGMPGSCNDINVLHRSPVFDSIASGTGPPVTYFVNGNEYNMGYYLADGIYPSWATLINGVPRPQSNKHKYFTQKQSEYRKDVECAFGRIQSMWGIMKGPARLWNPVDLNCIVECVVILNNMGIQYEANMEHISNEEYQSFSDEATISLPGT